MRITEIPVDGFEKVIHGTDDASGLNAFISVYDTTLGPALGGLRMLPYPNEADALHDANLLAKAMTYKSAVAGAALGGGKAVIVGDPTQKSPELFRALGKLIESLDGQYITAEDMNITVEDLEIVREETKWVSGLPVEKGSSGDPSPFTAEGCLIGIRACLQEAYGDTSMTERSVTILGVGAVGGRLARLCRDEGARVMLSDIDGAKADALAEEIGATHLVGNGAWVNERCDVLAPCARGGIVNKVTLSRLKCRIIAGAANNQLGHPEHAKDLEARNILYAPDYVINAGGIINISVEFLPEGYSIEEAHKRIARIEQTLGEIFEMAKQNGITTAEAADRIAEDRIAKGRKESS